MTTLQSTLKFVPIFALAGFLKAMGAETATPGPDPFPQGDNEWHLGYGVSSFADAGSFAEVARRGHGDQSAGRPQETNAVYTDNTNKIVLANPPTDCQNTGPAETNACAFTSRSATQEDDHNIRYSYRNWGGRCDMWLRVTLYPPATKWIWAAETPWSGGSPFIVVVPEGAKDARVFGKLAGKNIFFTPSDPLNDQDAQSFELIGHPVTTPGLGTIYRIKAKATTTAVSER